MDYVLVAPISYVLIYILSPLIRLKTSPFNHENHNFRSAIILSIIATWKTHEIPEHCPRYTRQPLKILLFFCNENFTGNPSLHLLQTLNPKSPTVLVTFTHKCDQNQYENPSILLRSMVIGFEACRRAWPLLSLIGKQFEFGWTCEEEMLILMKNSILSYNTQIDIGYCILVSHFGKTSFWPVGPSLVVVFLSSISTGLFWGEKCPGLLDRA